MKTDFKKKGNFLFLLQINKYLKKNICYNYNISFNSLLFLYISPEFRVFLFVCMQMNVVDFIICKCLKAEGNCATEMDENRENLIKSNSHRN